MTTTAPAPQQTPTPTAYSFPPTSVAAILVRPGDLLPLTGGGVVEAVLVTSRAVHLAFDRPVVSPYTRKKSHGMTLYKDDRVYVSRGVTA